MTRMSLRTGLAVAFSFAASYGLAQTAGAVRGEVQDKDGKPVEGAMVVMERLAGPDTGATKSFELKTDKKGRYARMGVPVGEYKIIAEKAGVGIGGVADFRVTSGTRPLDVPTIKLEPGKGAGAAVSDSIQNDFKRAADLVKQDKLDEAEKIYLSILEKFPAQSQVLQNLAVVSNRKKDPVAAEKYFRQAIEAKPDYVEPYLGLSNLLVMGGQSDKAIELLTKGAADMPESSDLQFQMGWVLFNVGRSAEAEPYLVKAESLGSTNPEVHFFLGSIAVGKNKVPEAIAHYEKYVATQAPNPENAQITQNLQTAQSLLTYLKNKK